MCFKYYKVMVYSEKHMAPIAIGVALIHPGSFHRKMIVKSASIAQFRIIFLFCLIINIQGSW
jgi:hypothetical protein